MNNPAPASLLLPKLLFEFVWWLITALVIYMVLAPIYAQLATYPFLVENIVFIVVFITLTRYVFLLKSSFFSHLLPFKLFLLFGCLPLVVYLFSCMYGFQVFLNESGSEGFIPYIYDMNTSPEQIEQVFVYFRREMIFFATGSIIITFITPIRLVISVWRVYNKTGKV